MYKEIICWGQSSIQVGACLTFGQPIFDQISQNVPQTLPEFLSAKPRAIPEHRGVVQKTQTKNKKETKKPLLATTKTNALTIFKGYNLQLTYLHS